jgi:hypothetical protein
VTERPARDEVSFIGTVEPDRAVTVQAEVAGRVARAEEIAISILAAEPCPFRLTHPSVRRTGCGRSSSALGLGSEGHPAWTQRVPCEVSDARAEEDRGESLQGGRYTPRAAGILCHQPAVPMMEAPDHGRLDDPALIRTLHESRLRGVLLQ